MLRGHRVRHLLPGLKAVCLGWVVSVAFNFLTTRRDAVLLLQACSDFAGRPLTHSMDVMTEGSKDILFATFSPA